MLEYLSQKGVLLGRKHRLVSGKVVYCISVGTTGRYFQLRKLPVAGRLLVRSCFGVMEEKGDTT